MKKATIAIMLLPFLLDVLLRYSDPTELVGGLFVFILWAFLTTVPCLAWGGYILRRHRSLGWCCIGVGVFHLVALILPCFSNAKVR